MYKPTVFNRVEHCIILTICN